MEDVVSNLYETSFSFHGTTGRRMMILPLTRLVPNRAICTKLVVSAG